MVSKKSNSPKVSVVSVSYNQEEYIRQTLEGFLDQQTDFDFEVVIADDASTDRTPEIIQEYADKYPRVIKPILRKKNIGVLQNFVDTLRAAKGKYIALCEGDDYWTDPEKLQRQFDFMESHPDYAVCFHPVRVVFENNEEKESIIPAIKGKFRPTREDLLKRNFIQTNSVMYRRQPYENMPQEDILPVDWFLHLYHAQFGKIGFINRAMSVYRRHPGGIWWDSYANMEGIWRKHGLRWLGLYVEILKMYRTKPAYRKIAEGSVINMFATLQKIAEKYGEDQFQKALARFPQEAGLYIDDLHNQIFDLQKHSREQAKIIKHYVDLSKQLEGEKSGLEDENRRLKGHLLVKLGKVVKNRLTRKQDQRG